ncbi:MAG: Hsp20 family protein [Rubrivivax sp.]|nr:Hsp20 family protein [Rubrivivax sp.]MDP3082425.1 Hsp20 family protein [Rubrivivax sp.]
MNELQTRDLMALDPIEDLLRGWVRPWRGELAQRAPQIRVDLSESNGDFRVKADVPGVKKEDIDVRIDGNQLTISAEIKSEKKEEQADGRVLRAERHVGYASRSLLLDCDVDEAKVVARYKDGVLDLTLPKKAGSKVQRIAIE